MPRPDYIAPILRRWYIVVVGLLITAGALATVAGSAQPTYRAEATSVLLPGDSTIPEGGNRFLYLGNLVQARDVVLTTLNSDQVRQQILGTRTDWDYAAVADTMANGPMIVISASAADAALAIRLRRTVQEELPNLLDSLQNEANTPETAKFTNLPLGEDAEAVSEGSGQIRLVLVVGLLGVGVTVLAAGSLDALIRSGQAARRRRREKRLPAVPETADEPGADAPGHPDPGASADLLTTTRAETPAAAGERGSG